MQRSLLTEKEIVEKTGISRAALQNYIERGWLSKPLVISAAGGSASARSAGQFDTAVVETIARIQALENSGASLEEIGVRLAADFADTPARPAVVHRANLDGTDALKLTIEQGLHIAYMLNHRFEVQWLNDAARDNMPGLGRPLPPDAAGRSLFKLILEQDGDLSTDHTAVLRMNLALAQAMTPFADWPNTLQVLPPQRLELLRQYCDETRTKNRSNQENQSLRSSTPSGVMQLPLRMGGSNPVNYTAHATRFREGIFVVVAPAGDKPGNDALARLLARRDLALHTLVNRHRPALTEIAVITARLQDASIICEDLPPGEYLELITQIWSAAEKIFDTHHGVCVRGSSGAMAGYFIARQNEDHLTQSIRCAMALKSAMAKLSAEW